MLSFNKLILLSFTALAMSTSAQAKEPALEGVISTQLCGEIDPYVIGDACLFLLERSAHGKKNQTERVVLIADDSVPYLKFNSDLPFEKLGEMVRISQTELEEVTNKEVVELAKEMVSHESGLTAQRVLKLAPEALVKTLKKPNLKNMECGDRIRLAALNKHQSRLEIVNETSMHYGETTKTSENTYKVTISDEVDLETWVVKTDSRCNILSVK